MTDHREIYFKIMKVGNILRKIEQDVRELQEAEEECFPYVVNNNKLSERFMSGHEQIATKLIDDVVNEIETKAYNKWQQSLK